MAWVVGVTIAVDADNVPEKVKAPGFVEVESDSRASRTRVVVLRRRLQDIAAS